MSDVNTLLNERLNKKERSTKVVALAERSASGDLTGFSRAFAVTELSEGEAASLESLLHNYATDSVDVASDLKALTALTAEVKAINNQAAMLHGERIKRAHEILTPYRDGAFTTWLTTTYGNRQTPYNLWQYYEFYQVTPKELRPQLELMPRQAVYALASREGRLDAKQRLVKNYQGETKQQLLTLIREKFPLDATDRRSENHGETAIRHLERVAATFRKSRRRLAPGQRRLVLELLDKIRVLVSEG